MRDSKLGRPIEINSQVVNHISDVIDPDRRLTVREISEDMGISKKVQVGKDQEKAQSEKDSHSKNRGGKKNKLTIRYLYHETYRKPNEQLFSQ